MLTHFHHKQQVVYDVAMAPHPHPSSSPEVDLNQVVAYNIREARLLRGWTQEELADRLEPYLGQRLTQAGVSSIERAWDGERRREFDAHELLIFAMVFDLPILWFLLPPPDDHRLMQSTTRPVDELYAWLLGRPDQLGPIYERLRQLGITDPTAAEETVEKITGVPATAKQWSYRERRKELLLALLDEHADSLDNAVDELGRWVDHLRQVGIRGFIAEHTGDEDFTFIEGEPPTESDEAKSDDTGEHQEEGAPT
ncbi:MAG: helix-turn-helix transcriptional regulator [Acidimicrobiia bacterium]